jgi:hypothetical protein
VQTDEEEDQRNAELRDRVDAIGIPDEPQRVRPDDDPGHDVAEHLRHAEPPPDEQQRKRGEQDDRHVEQQGLVMHAGRVSSCG